MGGHEKVMIDYFDGFEHYDDRDILYHWTNNGGLKTLQQLEEMNSEDRNKLLAWVKTKPYYKIIKVKGKMYILSHAGYDTEKPIEEHTWDNFMRGRDFYQKKLSGDYISIFGHTPTPLLWKEEGYKRNCAIWIDRKNKDKICIDSACYFGGSLSALRLDDGKAFYVHNPTGRYSVQSDIETVLDII